MYSGLSNKTLQNIILFAENKARLVKTALMSFVDQAEEGSIPIVGTQKSSQIAKIPADIEQLYLTIRRLVASKAGFASFN